MLARAQYRASVPPKIAPEGGLGAGNFHPHLRQVLPRGLGSKALKTGRTPCGCSPDKFRVYRGRWDRNRTCALRLWRPNPACRAVSGDVARCRTAPPSLSSDVAKCRPVSVVTGANTWAPQSNPSYKFALMLFQGSRSRSLGPDTIHSFLPSDIGRCERLRSRYLALHQRLRKGTRERSLGTTTTLAPSPSKRSTAMTPASSAGRGTETPRRWGAY